MRILCVLEIDVFVVQKCFFALQNVENCFYTIYIHDLLHGVTRGYRELQGIQGIRGGYNGLQRITRGYRGLQRIKEIFFLARTSLDTLSWFILYKNQRRRNVQCLTKTMD